MNKNDKSKMLIDIMYTKKYTTKNITQHALPSITRNLNLFWDLLEGLS